MKKFHLSFDFKGRHYDAAIRVRQRAWGREFTITALNWSLERLLYGNQVIQEVNGALQANVCKEKKDQTKLKLIIAARLSQYLKTPLLYRRSMPDDRPCGRRLERFASHSQASS